MTTERCFLTTDHDRKTGTTPPVALTSGQDRTLQVADQFLRGVAIVGRAVGSPAVLGLKVDPRGRPVRVRLEFQWDKHTIDLWDRFTGESVPRETAIDLRIILIRAQHILRQAVLLTAPRGNRMLRATAIFDLKAEEIPSDGLLLLELWGAAEWPIRLPAGGLPALAPNATSGLAFTRIDVHELESCPPPDLGGNGRASERHAVVSLGGLGRNELENPGPRRLRSGLIVVNPNERNLRLRLKETRGSAPTQDAGLRRLGTAAVERLRIRSSAAAGLVAAEGAEPAAIHLGSGQTARLHTEKGPAGWDLVVPAAGEPVLIVLPGLGSDDRYYKLVSCVPEPRITRPREPSTG